METKTIEVVRTVADLLEVLKKVPPLARVRFRVTMPGFITSGDLTKDCLHYEGEREDGSDGVLYFGTGSLRDDAHYFIDEHDKWLKHHRSFLRKWWRKKLPSFAMSDGALNKLADLADKINITR